MAEYAGTIEVVAILIFDARNRRSRFANEVGHDLQKGKGGSLFS